MFSNPLASQAPVKRGSTPLSLNAIAAGCVAIGWFFVVIAIAGSNNWIESTFTQTSSVTSGSTTTTTIATYYLSGTLNSGNSYSYTTTKSSSASSSSTSTSYQFSGYYQSIYYGSGCNTAISTLSDGCAAYSILYRLPGFISFLMIMSIIFGGAAFVAAFAMGQRLWVDAIANGSTGVSAANPAKNSAVSFARTAATSIAFDTGLAQFILNTVNVVVLLLIIVAWPSGLASINSHLISQIQTSLGAAASALTFSSKPYPGSGYFLCLAGLILYIVAMLASIALWLAEAAAAKRNAPASVIVQSPMGYAQPQGTPMSGATPAAGPQQQTMAHHSSMNHIMPQAQQQPASAATYAPSGVATVTMTQGGATVATTGQAY